jgi:membrane protease YdiL (CAAX protease family)
MTNAELDAESGTRRHPAGWPLPRVKGEVTLVVLGLYSGIYFYYSRSPVWSAMGLGGLTLTAVYVAVSLKYVNPTSLSELHVTRNRAGLYLLVGLLLILPAWFFDSLYTYLTRGDWLSLGIASSPTLILSILAVAMCEELFFRGYLLGRLKSLRGSRWVRVLLVCVLFMFYKVLVHSWEGWSPVTYASFFAFGAFKMTFETYWVDWTSSILTPIVIHIGWDLIMFQGYSGVPPWAL